MKLPTPQAVVSLRPITDADRDAVEALAVAPGQRSFVSSVRESILEASQEPGAHAIYWAIYADETPVGFAMIADEVDSPDYIPISSGSCSSTSATRDEASARQRST